MRVSRVRAVSGGEWRCLHCWRLNAHADVMCAWCGRDEEVPREKVYTVLCPCGAHSGPGSLSDAMRWGAVHRCVAVGEAVPS